jgi:hypothetical protein
MRKPNRYLSALCAACLCAVITVTSHAGIIDTPPAPAPTPTPIEEPSPTNTQTNDGGLLAAITAALVEVGVWLSSPLN